MDLKGYRRHSRLWRDNRYVYPVLSRRSSGLSIGVNLSPDQLCTFNCIYCQVDRRERTPREPVDIDILARELDAVLALVADGSIWADPLFDDVPESLHRLNDIALSGNGEPTACAEFPTVVARVADIKVRHGLDAVKIVLITNASTFDRPEVHKALELMARHQGEIWAKLDAGTEAYFQRVSRTHVPFDRILANLLEAAQHRPIVIQSLFMRIDGQAPPTREVDAYCARLRHITASGGRISQVQAYTVARDPAESSVAALPDPELDAIAERVRHTTGLSVSCFYGC
jgi:wyosine [tRNA(Phe)-imidazoG37] synthetase (radical SAM superfamily)